MKGQGLDDEKTEWPDVKKSPCPPSMDRGLFFAYLPLDVCQTAQQHFPACQQQIPVCQQQIPFSQQQIPVCQQQIPVCQQQIPFSQQQIPFSEQALPSPRCTAVQTPRPSACSFRKSPQPGPVNQDAYSPIPAPSGPTPWSISAAGNCPDAPD